MSNSRHVEIEPEEIILLSKKRVKYPCKCSQHDPPKPLLHTKEVFSDGWTKLICGRCGQVKFKFGKELEGEGQ